MDSSSTKAKQSLFFFSLKFKVFNAPLVSLCHNRVWSKVIKKKVYRFTKKVVEHETVASSVAMLYRIGLPLNTATP